MLDQRAFPDLARPHDVDDPAIAEAFDDARRQVALDHAFCAR
jgi:hypothetical protein